MLERAVVAAREHQQPLGLVGRGVQLLADRVGHLLVAPRVQQEQRGVAGPARPPRRRGRATRARLRAPRRSQREALEPSRSAGRAAAGPRARGRSPRPRRRAWSRAAALDREEAAHARAAQRDRRRVRAQQVAHGQHVVRSRSGPNSPSERPWPRASNASAARPWSRQPRGEVEVALLRRAGAVQDHDARLGLLARAGTARTRARRACRARAGRAGACFIIAADHGSDVARVPRLSARLPPERARAARGGRLRRDRARAGVRHAGVRVRRGRHARPRARLHARRSRARTDRFEVHLREQGVPLHRRLPR